LKKILEIPNFAVYYPAEVGDLTHRELFGKKCLFNLVIVPFFVIGYHE
jgi:hypothetical protein